MADKKHWVEDLFPPAFSLRSGNDQGKTFTDEANLCNSPQVAAQLIGEEDLSDKLTIPPTVFEQAARNLSSHDVAGVKNVYERVWLMTVLKEEEEKRKSSNDADEDCPHEEKTKQSIDVSTSTEDLESHLEPCIWNNTEIDILRVAFRTTKEQNIQYKAMLKAFSEDLANIQQKHTRQCKLIEHRTQQLNDALKANKRFHILTENYKTQLQKEINHVTQLEQEITKLKKSQNHNEDTIHQLRLASEREKIWKENECIDKEKRKHEFEHNMHMQEEKMNLIHVQDINKLKRIISEMEGKLAEEVKAHKRTKKGLDHLRLHFSSLPMAGQSTENTTVLRDQLSQFTY